jgi:hypothetical protein
MLNTPLRFMKLAVVARKKFEDMFRWKMSHWNKRHSHQ